MQGATKEKEMWEMQREPFRRAMTEQENVYKTLKKTPTYPLDPVVPFNPVQEKLQGYQTGYAFGDRPQNLQYAGENTLMDMLSGKLDTGAGTPYAGMADAFTQQSEQSMLDNLATARQGIVETQPGGGSMGDRVQARAISDNQRDINSKLAQMQLGAYQTAQGQRGSALGMYPGIMGAPTQFYSGIGQAVTPERDIQQAMRDADRAMYDQRRREAIEAMQGYGAGITNIVGGFANLEDLKKKGLLG